MMSTGTITTDTMTRERAGARVGAAGFGQLLHAEWTKFRTVRGWIIAMMVAAAVIVALGLLLGGHGSCGKNGPSSTCALPVGPDGLEVTDSFYFVHQPLAGDGSITVRVTSLTGLLPPSADESAAKGDVANGRAPDGGVPEGRPGLAPWAKAGLIIKAGTGTGSAYAAVMVTGSHGVRMQYNYLHDTAGQTGAVTVTSPRWLRLTRAGDSITAAESPDGTAWTTVGTAHLDGLPTTVQAGLFTTSPQYAEEMTSALGTAGASGGPTHATAAFDHVDRQGAWSAGTWSGENIGGPDNAPQLKAGFDQAAGVFTLTGSGDIAPAVAGAAGIGTTITETLVGTFAGLIIVIVVATMFITSEYRRDLISTTLAASPRRGRILVAKAIVLATVTFLVGLVSAAVVVTLGQPVLRGNGVYVFPATAVTEFRVVAGTAALLAVAAVLALALGTLVRRGAAAVTVAIVVIVLPYLLAVSVLPTSAARWLLRITPAAAFAVQQSTPQYDQVANIYTPAGGYFPLSPWSGFAVLGAWTVLALGLAVFLFRRRDA